MVSIHSITSDSELGNEFKNNLEHRALEQKFSYMEDSALVYYDRKNLKSAYMTDPADTLHIDDYIKFVSKVIKQKEETVIIVLGCGDMAREVEIVKNIGDKYSIDLIGVDSSLAMLDIAEKTINDNDVEAFLIHADFTKRKFRDDIDSLTKKYKKRIFAFIGGTFGNVNQTAIADSLYNLLDKDDLLWVDAQLRVSLKKLDDIKSFNAFFSLTKVPARVKFWTLPLRRVGIPVSAGEIVMDTEEESSVGILKFTISFKFKKLTKIIYNKEVIHFSNNDKISLYYFRIYHAPTFIKFFRDHGFELLDKHLPKKKGQFLFRKK